MCIVNANRLSRCRKIKQCAFADLRPYPGSPPIVYLFLGIDGCLVRPTEIPVIATHVMHFSMQPRYQSCPCLHRAAPANQSARQQLSLLRSHCVEHQNSNSCFRKRQSHFSLTPVTHTSQQLNSCLLYLDPTDKNSFSDPVTVIIESTDSFLVCSARVYAVFPTRHLSLYHSANNHSKPPIPFASLPALPKLQT
jgi:hypothetical protein